MYCSKVIFEVIFWKIAILFLWSNTFLLSTRKTVRVRHCTWPYDVLMTAAGGEIRLHARLRARRLGVKEKIFGSCTYQEVLIKHVGTSNWKIWFESRCRKQIFSLHTGIYCLIFLLKYCNFKFKITISINTQVKKLSDY